MAGDILIVDCVATNRIVLKVKLLTAQYRVRPCATIEDAQAEILASLPDLILIDTASNTKGVLAFCEELKDDPATNLIPIIATGGFPTPRDRVLALEAGADDVLRKPFDDHILQARFRSLLQARDAQQELRMREGTRTALGFAEAMSGFETRTNIVVTTPDTHPRSDINAVLKDSLNAQVATTSIEQLVTGRDDRITTDLYVIDFRDGLHDETVLFRLLSELRSRSSTRHAGLLALLPPHERQAAAMALDLGPNDVVCAHIDDAEIGHRCSVLIRAKREADALRRTVESGLEAAITDPLTGLFNRRYALPHLNRLSAESRKTGRQFALMVLDIDHFKAVNDTYGHQAGDDILIQVANRLRDNLRAVDLLARIGGEEFLVAIPNSDVVHARTAAERLCRLIADTPFFIGSDRTEVRASVSVGVSLSNGDDGYSVPDDLDDLVNEADAALYAAKNAGRNKVSLSAA